MREYVNESRRVRDDLAMSHEDREDVRRSLFAPPATFNETHVVKRRMKRLHRARIGHIVSREPR